MLLSLFPAYAAEVPDDPLSPGISEEEVTAPTPTEEVTESEESTEPAPTEEAVTPAPDEETPAPSEEPVPSPTPSEEAAEEDTLPPAEETQAPDELPPVEETEEPGELPPANEALLPEEAVMLLAEPLVTTELTAIDGYTRITEMPAGGLPLGKYLIVARFNNVYYMLYPGGVGATPTSKNAARLELDASGKATGYRAGYGTTYDSAPLSTDFTAAENKILKTGGTHTIANGQPNGGQTWDDYVVTATNPDNGTVYSLFNPNVYGNNSSSITLIGAPNNDGYFRLRNTASNNSQLIFFQQKNGTTYMNFNQSGGITGNDTDWSVDMMLFKSDRLELGLNFASALSGDQIGGGDVANTDPDGQNSWVFTGGRAAQGSFTDVKGARAYAGHFEEYIRYTHAKQLMPSGESSTPYFQRHVINTAYEGQTLAEIVTSFDSRIGALKPKVVSYLVEEGGSSEASFATNLDTLITKSLALRSNTGLIVIETLSAADKTAVENVVKDRPVADHANILVVNFDLTANQKTGGYPNANGHLEMAKQLANAVTDANVSSSANWPYGVSALPNSVMASDFPNKSTVATCTYTVPSTLNQAQKDLKAKAESNKGTSMTWLFMGDSITHGSAWTGGYDTLAQLFEKFVKDDLDRTKDIVINAGSSGATTTSTLTDLNRRLVKYDPDVVVLMLGTNDAGATKTSETTYKANLRTLLNKIKDMGAIPVLRTPPPTSNANYDIESYAGYIRDVVEEDDYKDSVILVDHFARWSSVNWSDLFTRDNLHPDEAGHVWFAHQIIKEMALWDPVNYSICKLEYVVMKERKPLTIPGYTQLTNLNALDENRGYLIVTRSADDTLYALYPSVDGETIGAGSLPAPNAPANGARTAQLTVSGSNVSAKWLKNGSSLDMINLQFSIKKSGDGYVFTAFNGRHLNMNNNMFEAGEVALNVVNRGTAALNAYTIKNTSSNRVLDFTKTGDPNAFGSTTTEWGTDFWCPRASMMSVYLFASNEDGIPTAKDSIEQLLKKAAGLVEADYTRASWASLQTAIASAKSVLESGEPNGDAQVYVNAREVLKNAFARLQSRPVPPTVPAGAVKKELKDILPASGTTKAQPYTAGTGGSNNFRIPAMITLTHQKDSSKNGRLVTAIDARWNHAGDACALDTILSYSDDNGANWHFSFPNYFGDSTDAKDSYGTAFIDPVLVEDNDGSIFMMVDLYPGGVAINTAPMRPATATGYVTIDGKKRLALYTSPQTTAQTDTNYDYYVGDFESGYAPVMAPMANAADVFVGFYVDEHYYLYYTTGAFAGRNPNAEKIWCPRLGENTYVQQNIFFYNATLHARNVSYLWITKSTDGGETWSAPIMVNDQVRTGNDQFYGVGPGAGLCMDNGIIILPTYTNSTERAGFIYSTDKGQTWHRGNNATINHSSESCMVQIDANTIRHFYRDNDYDTIRYTDHTWNGSSWVTSSPVVTTAHKTKGCQLSAIKYSKQIDGKDAIILSTAAGSGRNRTTGRLYVFLVNPDKTMTLAYTYSINGDSYYAYSSLSETKNGNIALLYESAAATALFKIIAFTDIVPVLAVTGYEGNYDGNAHTVTVDATANGTIEYSTNNGTSWSSTKPTFTDAGAHTVKVRGTWGSTVKEATATVVIHKETVLLAVISDKGAALKAGETATFTVTGVPDEATADQLTLVCSGTHTGGDGTIALTKQSNGNYTGSHTVQAGIHKFTLTFAGSTNHEAATADYTVTVLEGDIDLTIRAYDGIYDGKPHTITVTPGSGVTMTYCDTENGTYTGTKPTFTNAGIHTVYYKATKGSTTAAGAANVTIHKAVPTITITPVKGTDILTTDLPSPLTVSGVPAPDQGKLTVTSYNDILRDMTRNSNGTWTVIPGLPPVSRDYTFVATFDPTQTQDGTAITEENYEWATAEVTVSVARPNDVPEIIDFYFANGVTSDVSTPDIGTYEVIYDGDPHDPLPALIYDSTTMELSFRTIVDDPETSDPGSVWDTTPPTFRQPGTYNVACMATLKDSSSAKILTVEIKIVEKYIPTTLTLSSNFPAFSGGGKLVLTVDGVPRAGLLTLTCDKNLTATETSRGVFTVNLPNKTEDYTFVAEFAGAGSYQPAVSNPCVVSVAAGTGSNSGGGGGGGGSIPGDVGIDNSITTTVKNPSTGTITTTTKMPNGVKVVTVDNPETGVTAKVTVPSDVADAKVYVPSTSLDYSTVALDKDGNLILLSVPNAEVNKMLLRLEESQELTLVRKPHAFEDVEEHWAKDAISFTTAHQLFQGVSDTEFAPQTTMTRGMLVTVLARLDGVDTSGGEIWYEKGAQWAQEMEISDTYNLDADVSREQLATMLWRYAGCPTTIGDLSAFADGDSVNAFARTAMRWAVTQGIFDGNDMGLLAPQASASRAEVSTAMLRFCRYLVK